jgi:16S rRNA (cytosine967-C5)-methyltransferase
VQRAGPPKLETPGDARRAALRALRAVLQEGATLSRALPPVLEALTDPRDRALAGELSYGTLRWLPRLEALLAAVLRHPLREREVGVRLALLLGLYQLLYTRVPAYAAVAETLALLEREGRGWAKGLANALLRRVDREGPAILARVDRSPQARYAHPAWLISALRQAWPEDWAAVLEANNARPPLTLRVNARLGDREAYIRALASAGLAGRPAAHTTHGVTVEPAVDVERLPGFSAGLCSVQDAAAQLAAPLLGLAPGQRVLDACAAPGGKTAHLLESEPELSEVVAVERDPERAARLAETLARLGLRATLVTGDAARLQAWWDGRPFDRVLLDAPCSASGVIRRHPDIKARLTPGQLPQLLAEQARLLDGVWPLLARGGALLYATCSVLPEENERQLARFLSAHPEARPMPLDAGWGRPRGCARQVLPGEAGMDGFFYALLKKGG